MFCPELGFQLLSQVFEPSSWLAIVPPLAGRGGFRGLAQHPKFQSLLRTLPFDPAPLGRLVRVVYFDKQPDSNWGVPFHQDLSLPVRACLRERFPEYGPWSVKDGVAHAQPPRHVLESMTSLRLHLDNCGPDNGPLQLIPGSHRAGILDREAIAQWTQSEPWTCTCLAGQILAFSPLTLHSSSKARKPGHRRVIQLEYCSSNLPLELATSVFP